MSLHTLANHMAAQGRGPDRSLVHMSPREIQGLQSLAQAHGRSLTINPQTGMPEAGILEDILPSIAGFAMDAFAPGSGAIASGIGSLLGGGSSDTSTRSNPMGLASTSLERGLQAGFNTNTDIYEPSSGQISEKESPAGAFNAIQSSVTPEPPKDYLKDTKYDMYTAPSYSGYGATQHYDSGGMTIGNIGAPVDAKGNPIVIDPYDTRTDSQKAQDYLLGKSGAVNPFLFYHGAIPPEAKAALASSQLAALYPETVSSMGSRGSREKTEDRYVPLSPLASPEEGSLGFQFLDAYGRIPFLPGSMLAAGAAQNMLPGQITQAGINADKALRDAKFGYAYGDMFGKGNTGRIDTFAGAGYGVGEMGNPYTRTVMTGAGIPANPMSIDPAQAGQLIDNERRAAEQNAQDARIAAFDESREGSRGGGGYGGDGGFNTSGGGSTEGKSARDGMGFGGSGLAHGGIAALAQGGYNLGSYSDGGRLLRGPGDGVSDDIPATIGQNQPARLADGEFVIPARIVSELGNGSTEAGARKLYAMMDRVQKARSKTVGKDKVAANSRADKYLPS